MTLFVFTYAHAATGTNSIGTVSARGDVRVDGYLVQSDGTLFDGTAVETQQAGATLRLNNGTEIKLATNSKGLVYRDRLVLLQGESQLKASSTPYQLEAKGFHVSPSGPDNVGLISLNRPNSVDVAAVSGEFRVTSGDGVSPERLSAGEARALPDDTNPPAGNWSTVEIEGMVSKENDQIWFTASDGTKYLVRGGPFMENFVGQKVVLSGKILYANQPGKSNELVIQSIRGVRGGAWFAGASVADKVILIGIAGGAAAGGAYAGYESTQPPSSR
jgi:hypothetical protein